MILYGRSRRTALGRGLNKLQITEPQWGFPGESFSNPFKPRSPDFAPGGAL